MRDGIAEYIRIKQPPTALQAVSDSRLELERALRQRGFSFQHVTDMDGSLAYHVAFIAYVHAALPLRHRRRPPGRKRPTPTLIVRGRDRGLHRSAQGRGDWSAAQHRPPAQPGAQTGGGPLLEQMRVSVERSRGFDP
jgi:hypothetical protein